MGFNGFFIIIVFGRLGAFTDGRLDGFALRGGRLGGDDFFGTFDFRALGNGGGTLFGRLADDETLDVEVRSPTKLFSLSLFVSSLEFIRSPTK